VYHICTSARFNQISYNKENLRYLFSNTFRTHKILLQDKCIEDDTKAAASQSPNCIKNQKNKIWWKTIFNMADGITTPCNVARSWHWFHQVTAPEMWHVALESWQWLHQVAAPCNVIHGSGMTCHWICPVAAPYNMTRSSGIMTLSSPGGSTLQCGRWLWDDMPWNSPKCPPYWNSTSGFDFDHITAVDMSFCTSLRNFIQIGPPSAEKRTLCWFSRWRISAILDFMGPIMGSLNSPCTTSYRSSIETIALNCLVFEKIPFFCILATDRQTKEQTNRASNFIRQNNEKIQIYCWIMNIIHLDSNDALSRSRYRERRLNEQLDMPISDSSF